jgi:hypothetical protein
MKTEGVVCFHQGWTDIINCLSLISFYLQRYKKLYILIREDAVPLVSYYIQSVANSVSLIAVDKNILDTITPLHILDYLAININTVDLLFHGNFDIFRGDFFSGRFATHGHTCFVKSFYELYGISPAARISCFTLERNMELENKVYANFIETYGNTYALHHEVSDCIPTGTMTMCYVNLAERSQVFFDMIKVLENAKEIHLLDSVWAAILYLLQGQYGICEHIPVHVYCKRGYVSMFTDPVTLPNWTIHSAYPI